MVLPKDKSNPGHFNLFGVKVQISNLSKAQHVMIRKFL